MGDMEKAVCMTDHFDKIQKLPDPIPGVPNFRRVPGFKVYCCGQPTLDGFEKVLEKVTGSIYPKDGPIIWFNLRQEPTVYVNGNPVCARPPNKIGEYAEVKDHILRNYDFIIVLFSLVPSPGTSSRHRRQPSPGSAREGRASTMGS